MVFAKKDKDYFKKSNNYLENKFLICIFIVFAHKNIATLAAGEGSCFCMGMMFRIKIPFEGFIFTTTFWTFFIQLAKIHVITSPVTNNYVGTSIFL